MNKKPLSLLQHENPLITLPTTKTKPADRVGVHSWFKDYSAFSEKFVIAAIEAIAETDNPTVCDPFLGTGTSLVASAKVGCPFIGVELSPFSALLSRTKVSCKADESIVRKLLKSKPLKNLDVPASLYDFYSADDLTYILGVLSGISKLLDKDGEKLLNSLISLQGKEYDSARVALTILLLSAKTVSKTSKGSNPVWHRLAKASAKKVSKLSDITISKIDKYIDDINAAKLKCHDIKIVWGDSRATKIHSNSFDILVTSPPYLNRLDYVVSQLPEIVLLSLLYKQNLDDLRKQMIGTTKIVEKGEPDILWGRTCLNTIEEIRRHPSKASSTYYVWNYYKYFKDMFACFKEMKRLARARSQGVLVVQNSHYKDISIPVTQIFTEMGKHIGIEINEVMHFDVKSHMGLLSPHQRTYTPNKVLKEAVLHFRF